MLPQKQVPDPCFRCPEETCKGLHCPFIRDQEEVFDPKENGKARRFFQKKTQVPEDISAMLHSLGISIPNTPQVYVEILPQEKKNITLVRVISCGKTTFEKKVAKKIKRKATLKYKKGNLISCSV